MATKGKRSKQKDRREKLVAFVLGNRDAKNEKELVALTLSHDVMVNSSDEKGTVFGDPEVLRGLSPGEACLEFVTDLLEYKKKKLAKSGIAWELGSDDLVEFERNLFGQVIANIDNVVRFLTGAFRYRDNLYWDDFKRRIYFIDNGVKREWTDSDDFELAVELQRFHDFVTVTDSLVHKGVRAFAFKKRRNELADFFRSVKWDGVGRIDRYFCDYLGAPDSEYVRCASKNFFISMIARVLQPGCKVDNMVILEGEQGLQKSTASAVLVGDSYFCEMSESIDSKDFLLALQGMVLVEIAELDSFSKAEMTKVKQVITNRIDRYRAPYARCAEDVPRTCVFIGTTNEHCYLNDVTGGRRFWPVKVGEIKLELIRRDRIQLFAEASHRYLAGESWWEMPTDATRKEQEERRVVDAFEEQIKDWAETKTSIKVTDVARYALGIEPHNLDLSKQKRIAKSLRACGFIPKLVWDADEKKPHRSWVKNNA